MSDRCEAGGDSQKWIVCHEDDRGDANVACMESVSKGYRTLVSARSPGLSPGTRSTRRSFASGRVIHS